MLGYHKIHIPHNDKMQNKVATTDTLSYDIQKIHYIGLLWNQQLFSLLRPS